MKTIEKQWGNFLWMWSTTQNSQKALLLPHSHELSHIQKNLRRRLIDFLWKSFSSARLLKSYLSTLRRSKMSSLEYNFFESCFFSRKTFKSHLLKWLCNLIWKNAFMKLQNVWEREGKQAKEHFFVQFLLLFFHTSLNSLFTFIFFPFAHLFAHKVLTFNFIFCCFWIKILVLHLKSLYLTPTMPWWCFLYFMWM